MWINIIILTTQQVAEQAITATANVQYKMLSDAHSFEDIIFKYSKCSKKSQVEITTK